MTSLKLYTKKRRKRIGPEACLQKTVVQHLLVAGIRNIIYFSVPNERKCSAIMGAHLKEMGLLPGVADLVIILPGQAPCFLELKALNERQSEDQISFEYLCARNGCRYGLADNINDALTILEAWGALRSSSRRAA